jgi:putative transcriptional regulator
MSAADLMTGRLLVATPKLEDPNFARSVVLLLDYDEDGALGVIISRPTTVPVAEVLPAWSDLVTGPDVLFSGGPVATDSALAVAVLDGTDEDETPVGWRPLYPGAGLVDLDAPPELLSGVLTGMRVFAGYAGWGPGQLETEIERDDWIIAGSEVDDVFDDDAPTMWSRVLDRQGGQLRLLARMPLDPSLN